MKMNENRQNLSHFNFHAKNNIFSCIEKSSEIVISNRSILTRKLIKSIKSPFSELNFFFREIAMFVFIFTNKHCFSRVNLSFKKLQFQPL